MKIVVCFVVCVGFFLFVCLFFVFFVFLFLGGRLFCCSFAVTCFNVLVWFGVCNDCSRMVVVVMAFEEGVGVGGRLMFTTAW